MTIEFIGPLVLAVVGSRRPRDLVWVLLAAVGVALLGAERADLDLVGVLFALLAGAMWATYILLSGATGRRWDGLEGLALASVVAALLVTPVLAATELLGSGDTELFSARVLLLGAAVGLLSSVVPYSCELVALRSLRPAVFGILMSLEPAAAALVGILVLSELLSRAAVGGGRLRDRRQHRRHPPAERPRRAGSGLTSAQSRQNSLPSTSCITRHDSFSSSASSSCTRTAPSGSSRAHSASSVARRSSPTSPVPTRTSRCSRFLATLPSGTRWKNSRGPAPVGSTHAYDEPCCSGGSERSASSQLANPSGGGGTTYPSTSHQKRATRSGSAQSNVTWTCRTDVIAPP